jgi:3'(2'), 5'-bisphosphate nucleotidase
MSETDAALAARLAEQAGALVLAERERWRAKGIDPALQGKLGDAAANLFLCTELALARPDDAVLSEETQDGPARQGKDRVWIVDPIDGTREYAEGRGDWAVHVGLAVRGEASAGAVALPGMGLVFRTDELGKVPAMRTPPRMLVSRSRPPAAALAVAQAIGAELVAMGSAGAKAMAVVRGEAEIYLHTGGQYEWDNCAPAAVALAHGLHASRTDGSALTYNSADPYLPDLLICRREWAGPVLAEMARIVQCGD